MIHSITQPKSATPFPGQDGKYHTFYVTINLVNGDFYYGKHTSKDIDDGYLGSGNRLRRSVKKYGKENFKRYDLCFFSTPNDAYEAEELMVTRDVIENPKCMNCMGGGRGGGTPSSDTRVKLSKVHRGKVVGSETRKLLSLASKKNNSHLNLEVHRKEMGNPFKGMKHTDEARRKMSEKQRELWRQGTYDQMIRVRKPWQEKNAMRNSSVMMMWRMAIEMRELYDLDNNITRKEMKRTTGWEGDTTTLVSIIDKFKRGWDPRKDDDFLSWLSSINVS